MGICLLALAKQKKMIKQILRTAWAHLRPINYCVWEHSVKTVAELYGEPKQTDKIFGPEWITRYDFTDLDGMATWVKPTGVVNIDSDLLVEEQRTGDEVV